MITGPFVHHFLKTLKKMWQELLTLMPSYEKGVLAGAPAALCYVIVTSKDPARL